MSDAEGLPAGCPVQADNDVEATPATEALTSELTSDPPFHLDLTS